LELYERFPCNDRAELCKREGEVIREIGTINKQIAGRTRQERYQDNRDNELEYNKKWRENNPEYKKKWRENNTEHIREYHKDWRSRKRSATP
jgi:hypothetical protein